MIIDFHTHAFPDALASRALDILKNRSKRIPNSKGTYDDNLRVMEEAGIDISINLPTITDPKQFNSILRFAMQINEKVQKSSSSKIISFGGIHPDSPNYKEEILTIYNNNIKGFKIHPDYQKTFIDDIKYLRILDYANELGLIVTTHAGFDPVSPNCIHATVDRILTVLREVKPKKLVLAHMGSMVYSEDILSKLAGEDVYFDTAMCLHLMEKKHVVDIIKTHGSNKILFGTDLPWGSAIDYPQLLEELPLSSSEKEDILWRNATQLLEI